MHLFFSLYKYFYSYRRQEYQRLGKVDTSNFIIYIGPDRDFMLNFYPGYDYTLNCDSCHEFTQVIIQR